MEVDKPTYSRNIDTIENITHIDFIVYSDCPKEFVIFSSIQDIYNSSEPTHLGQPLICPHCGAGSNNYWERYSDSTSKLN